MEYICKNALKITYLSSSVLSLKTQHGSNDSPDLMVPQMALTSQMVTDKTKSWKSVKWAYREERGWGRGCKRAGVTIIALYSLQNCQRNLFKRYIPYVNKIVKEWNYGLKMQRATAKHYMGLSESYGRRGRKIVGARKAKDTTRKPTQSTNGLLRAHRDRTDNQGACVGLT